MPDVNICHGDTIEVLPTLEAQSVQTVVTSPPYFGLRDYQLLPTNWPAVSYAPIAGMAEVEIPAWEGCLGLEPTPDMYIGHLVHVFREVRRVLRDDGTVFLNLGDSYAQSSKWGGSSGNLNYTSKNGNIPRIKKPMVLPDKNLMMMPARLALALQADGWILRSDIIWAKKNGMPESVTDRPTKSHEHIFLLSKQAKYFYDGEAVRQKAGNNNHGSPKINPGNKRKTLGSYEGSTLGKWTKEDQGRGANRRDVWHMATQPYPEAHFAVFPSAIPELCIKAGTPEKGCCVECGKAWERVTEKSPVENPAGYNGSKFTNGKTAAPRDNVGQGLRYETVATGRFESACKHDTGVRPAIVLDPFSGAGTTGLVAIKLGRDYVGIEKSAKYVEMSRARLAKPAQMVLIA